MMLRNDEGLMDSFLDALFVVNERVNLFSRKLDRSQVEELIADHFDLYEYMCGCVDSGVGVADIGSGNGILGLGLHFWMKSRSKGVEVDLVEPRLRKANGLMDLVRVLRLDNVRVCHTDLLAYVKKIRKPYVLIARGFPDNQLVVDQVLGKNIVGCGLISSEKKIRDLVLPRHCGKRIAKIKNRDHLNTLFLECFT